ncbi:hypothetical protein RFI_17613, partial [Reticulomyxa filosa]
CLIFVIITEYVFRFILLLGIKNDCHYNYIILRLNKIENAFLLLTTFVLYEKIMYIFLQLSLRKNQQDVSQDAFIFQMDTSVELNDLRGSSPVPAPSVEPMGNFPDTSRLEPIPDEELTIARDIESTPGPVNTNDNTIDDIFSDVALDFSTAATELIAMRESRGNPFPSFVRCSDKPQLNVIMARAKQPAWEWHYIYTHAIHPMGTFHIAWSLFVWIMLLYTLIEMPFTLAFEIPINNLNTWYGILNMFIDITLTVDVALNFRTAYFDYFDRGFRSEIVTDPSKIAKKFSHIHIHVHIFIYVYVHYHDEPYTTQLDQFRQQQKDIFGRGFCRIY